MWNFQQLYMTWKIKLYERACVSDKRDILSCTKDGQLKVVDLRTMSVKSTLGSDSLRIGSDYCRASLSPDGHYAMVGSTDGSVFIFDVNTQKVEKTLKAHQ